MAAAEQVRAPWRLPCYARCHQELRSTSGCDGSENSREFCPRWRVHRGERRKIWRIAFAVLGYLERWLLRCVSFCFRQVGERSGHGSGHGSGHAVTGAVTVF